MPKTLLALQELGNIGFGVAENLALQNLPNFGTFAKVAKVTRELPKTLLALPTLLLLLLAVTALLLA